MARGHSVTFRTRVQYVYAMIEKITLTIFWIAMLACAASVLTVIWFESLIPERIAPTFFVIGLASFLIWAPIVVYRFLHKLP